MRKQFGVAAATVFVIAATVGVAGPAVAQTQLVMPATKGMILQTAVNAVNAVAAPEELNLVYVPRNVNQKVLNLTNWAVCTTSPSAGRNISQKTKRVVFSVRRPNEKC